MVVDKVPDVDAKPTKVAELVPPDTVYVFPVTKPDPLVKRVIPVITPLASVVALPVAAVPPLKILTGKLV